MFGVWVISRGGLCISRATYRSFDFNESLISGFLSAISSFGSSVVAAGDLHSLRFGFMNMVLCHGDPLVAVAGAATENELVLFRVGNQIQEAFLEKYSEIYHDSQESGTFGSFEGFANEIDTLVGSEHLTGEAEVEGSSKIAEVLEGFIKGEETPRDSALRIIETLAPKTGDSRQRVVETISSLEGIEDLPLNISELLQEVESRMSRVSKIDKIALSLVHGISRAKRRGDADLGDQVLEGDAS